MSHPTRDIQGGFSTYGAAEFYPGRELNFTFSNGTNITSFWLARYDFPQEPPEGIITPRDFYNFFVLGHAPPPQTRKQRRASTAPGLGDYIMQALNPSTGTQSSTAQSSSTQTSSAATYTHDPDANSWYEPSRGAYPDPDVAQPDLSVLGGGIVSGYFLDDISTAVLSIPGFQQYGEYIESFADTVGVFIANATTKGLKKLVVDLQQNSGGEVLLAITTFKQLFPQIDPFGGSRRRSHRLASILGSSTNSWWSSMNETDRNQAWWKSLYEGKEWVVSDRLNAETGQNFSNWGQYYGPRRYNGDNFSVVVCWWPTRDADDR
jgi:Peptidase family S41